MEDNINSRDHVDKTFYSKKSAMLLELLSVLGLPAILFVISNWLGSISMLGIAISVLGYLLSIVLVWRVLKSRSSGFHEIGLAEPKSWLRTVLLGIGVLIITVVVIVGLQVLFLNLFSPRVDPIYESRFDVLQGNLPLLLLFAMSAFTTVAFSEEIVYRAFLMNWLAALLGDTKNAWRAALIISATVFGLAHFVEGPLWILVTTTIGLLFGTSYLSTKRNLWVTIIAHGMLNTLQFTLVYA